MISNGSERATVLHPVAALGVLVVGWTLMQVTVFVLARTFGLRLALLGGEIMLALPALVALAASGVQFQDGLALWPVGRRTVWLSLAVGVCFWAASAGILTVQSLFWQPSPAMLEMFRRLHAALRPSGPVDALFSVVSIAVAPAVCEELLFRGVVLTSFLRPFGPAGAVAASAVLFGLIHFDFRLPFALVLGSALALVRLRTGSLIPPAVVHATVNTITFLAAPYTDTPDAVPETRPVLALAILAGGLVASAVAVRLLPRKAR